MAKKNNTGTLIVAAIVVLGAIYVFAPDTFSGVLGQTQSVIPDRSSPTDTGGVAFCGDDGQADVDFRYRNTLNTTQADYHSTTGSITLTLVDADTNKIRQTLTADNADGTYDSVQNGADCGKSYYVAIVDSGDEVAAKSATATADAATVEFEVEGARSSELNFNLYSTSFGNETNAGANGQDFTTVTNNDLDVGTTVDLRYDVAAATAAAQFGAKERLCETDTGVCGSAFVCATGASNVYQESDLSISGGAIMGRTSSLPSLCQISSPTNAGVGRAAFEVAPITNADGRMAGTLSVTAGLSAPADTNNVQFLWMDNSYYAGNDNTVKVGTDDDTGTDNGETNRYFEVNIQ